MLRRLNLAVWIDAVFGPLTLSLGLCATALLMARLLLPELAGWTLLLPIGVPFAAQGAGLAPLLAP